MVNKTTVILECSITLLFYAIVIFCFYKACLVFILKISNLKKNCTTSTEKIKTLTIDLTL